MKLEQDIVSRTDVERLVQEFYQKVRADELIARHFAQVDWDHHTPVIVDFWSMILLGDSAYKGNPFSKHVHLNLSRADFERWLMLFHKTVDELFTGAKAEEAKQRASQIAGLFQFKMGLLVGS